MANGFLGIDEVKAMCEKEKPDVLVRTAKVSLSSLPFDLNPRPFTKIQIIDIYQFCASMWTKEESDEIQRIAKETVPGIKTMAIPEGLQVEKGPDAVVAFLKEKWP